MASQPSFRVDLESDTAAVQDEGELLSRMQRGDGRAFETAFLAYYDRLCRFAAGFVRGPDEAEEVVQDVFARVWAQRESLRVRESVRAYLYAATRNECLLQTRRQRIASRWQIAAAAGDRPTAMGEGPTGPERQLESNEFDMVLTRALQRLPDRCRHTFLLRRQHGLMPQEIARVMGVSVKTVEAQLNKALHVMREELAQLR